MVPAKSKLLLFITGLLWISFYHGITPVLSSSSDPIIGTSDNSSSEVDSNQDFYLNTGRPANCSGTITTLRYCYYGQSDNNRNTYQSSVALYRLMNGRTNIYVRVSDTIAISKRTPISDVPPAEALLPGFNCDSYKLNESIRVQTGDVIGACIDNDGPIRQLNLVSNNENAYDILFADSDDVGCRNSISFLPNRISEIDFQTTQNRILHMYAEIIPDDMATTTIIETTAANMAKENFLIVAIGSSIAGIVLGILIITVMLVIVFMATGRKKRKHSNNELRVQKRRAHRRTLSTNLISEYNEVEDNAAYGMRVYQNFACPYEIAEDATFMRNEAHSQLQTESSASISEVSVPSIARQRNNHYESDSQYNPPRSEYHFYFTLEGPDYPYDELLEKNKTQDLYANVTQFNEPARIEEDLYVQIKSCRIQNINRSSIQITGHLGSGQFGSVKEGVWSVESCQVKVALKTLNQDTTNENKMKFLQEAAIMAQFRHPNVVLLYGIVSKEEPITLVVQLVEKGDLRNYLMAIRPNPGELPSPNLPGLLLSFSQHVALGMQYLSGKGFIHRDLAARNILISKNNFCKIADFGLSRDLLDEMYYISKGGVIPIKWTAPEAIEQKKYSIASDVWSYGCLLYEIWSLGHKPYDQFSNVEAIRFVRKGKRLPPPPGCPRAIYDLMIKCWNPTAPERPNFRTINLRLLDNEQGVLSIPQEALDTHQQAGVLGSSLKSGERMYEDLQMKYIEVEYYAII